MVEYKTFIGELVDNVYIERLTLRLHKIKTINNTKENHSSFTKCVEVRSKNKNITKEELIEKGLVELDKDFDKNEYIILDFHKGVVYYCG